MKKLLILTFIISGCLLLLPNLTKAGTYEDPNDPNEVYKAGECIMVDTRSEADSSHVYTLDPGHTKQCNDKYVNNWRRNARCDELQFHVDHGTSLSRLQSWLVGVAKSWYSDIGTTHFKHQTISTSNTVNHDAAWFYVDADGIHRIYDWLTALSNGLIVGDRLSIPADHTTVFYELVTIGTPLGFNDGQYATKIDTIWHEEDRDFSILPTPMADELNYYVIESSSQSVFEECQLYCRPYVDGHAALLDWDWMQRNPGCPLAD